MFPVDKYFAELLGAFAGDGWMSKGNSGISLFISGNPKDERDYYDKRIKFLFKKVFRKEVFPREFSYWGTYGICVGNKGITKEFISAGMIVGKKAHKVTVPEEIILNHFLYTSFIRGLFDTDGCIYFTKSYNKNASKWQKLTKHKPIITFKTVSFCLASQLKKLLKNCGVESGLRKSLPYNGNYASYELRIEGKKKAKMFFKVIKPKSIKHLAKFNLWLSQGFYSIS